MKNGTDWIAWVLQALAGLVVGAVIGLFSIAAREDGFRIAPAHLPSFLIGAALVGAGLAARFGDRLWLSYRVLPIEESSQTWQSRSLAMGIVFIGIAIIAGTLARHFHLIE